jgi:hypothetical protein
VAKPENQYYFRDAKNAEHGRDWQKEHPGYWKNTARYRRRTLKDGCSEQAPAVQEVEPNSPSRTLKDLCSMQVPLFVGLISMNGSVNGSVPAIGQFGHPRASRFPAAGGNEGDACDAEGGHSFTTNRFGHVTPSVDRALGRLGWRGLRERFGLR